MSKSLKALVGLGFLAIVAACADTGDVEEYVVVEQPVVSAEPVFTGKYN